MFKASVACATVKLPILVPFRNNQTAHSKHTRLGSKARAGHRFVPADHIEGVLKLGLWVSVQRRNKFKMSENRRRRLNDPYHYTARV